MEKLLQQYISLGLSVIPLGTIKLVVDSLGVEHKDIIYPYPWKKYQTTRATLEEALVWNAKNIGIVTGDISGILVLDLDDYKPTYNKELVHSWNLPITPTVQTARGGKQLYFRIPKGLGIRNDAGIFEKSSCIDIRCDGGMVIAPPTVTEYGEYSWIVSPDEVPFANIPEKLLELLLSKSTQQKPKKEMLDLVELKEGEGRNNAMASFIGKIISNMNELDWGKDAWQLAEAVNRTYQPPLSREELFSIYRSITGIEHDRRIAQKNTAPGTSAKERPNPFLSSYTQSQSLTMNFPPPQFLVDKLIEIGGIQEIASPSSSWKSWICLHMADCIALGKPVFGEFDTEQGNVMYINEDDPDTSIVNRSRILSMNNPNLHFVPRSGFKIDNKKDYEYLTEFIKEKNIKLVIFDTFSTIHNAEEDKRDSMQPIMDLLGKINDIGKVTVILVHHFKKMPMHGTKDDYYGNIDSQRGSSAIVGSLSGVLSSQECIDDGQKYLIIRTIKIKNAEKLPPQRVNIVIGPDKKISFEFVGEIDQDKISIGKAVTKIKECLTFNSGWQSKKQIVEFSGVRSNDFNPAINQLVISKEVIKRDFSQLEKMGDIPVEAKEYERKTGKKKQGVTLYYKAVKIIDNVDGF